MAYINTSTVASAERNLEENVMADRVMEGSLVESAQATEVEPPKKAKSKEGKVKRREDKTLEQVLKALGSLETTEEKLAALCKKYTDLLDEHRQLQNNFKINQKSLTMVVKEKEQLQSEHSKGILAKSKLESLCRELQRHNKLIKEESLGRAKEEEEKRKEVTNKFQTTINDIQTQMNEHYDKNSKLREENIELATKLKSFIEQYELREQHYEKVLKQKDLEQQLVEAKMAQATLQMADEKEKGLMEKERLIKDATEAHKHIMMMETQEKQLKEQVALYTEKYEDFQSTLTKSNSVFQSFKTEMDKMTKKIKKLEKETNMWRQRWENANRALLDMAEEKTRTDKEMLTHQRKVKKLESLCRALQEEGRSKANTPNKDLPQTVTEDEPVKKDESNSDDDAAVKTVDIVATKTPPNTPEDGGQSRASPVNVVTGEQLPTNTPANELIETSDQSTAVSQSDEQSQETAGAAISEQNMASSND